MEPFEESDRFNPPSRAKMADILESVRDGQADPAWVEHLFRWFLVKTRPATGAVLPPEFIDFLRHGFAAWLGNPSEGVLERAFGVRRGPGKPKGDVWRDQWVALLLLKRRLAGESFQDACVSVSQVDLVEAGVTLDARSVANRWREHKEFALDWLIVERAQSVGDSAVDSIITVPEARRLRKMFPGREFVQDIPENYPQ